MQNLQHKLRDSGDKELDKKEHSCTFLSPRKERKMEVFFIEGFSIVMKELRFKSPLIRSLQAFTEKKKDN